MNYLQPKKRYIALHHSNEKKNQGISLVGLLIAMAIAGVLLNGLITVFSSNQNTSRMIHDFGSLQESMRAANDTLEISIRQAGHFGGIEPTSLEIHSSLSLTGVGNCNMAWLTDTDTMIRAYDGASAITSVQDIPSGCIDTSDYQPDTDILSLKYASALELTEYDNLDNNTVYVRTVLAGDDAGQGQILKGSNKATTIGLVSGEPNDPAGTYNYTFENELYYVRQCTNKVEDVCDDTTPSLVRYYLEDGVFTEQVIVSGVEQFQVEFGVDSDSDFTADVYQSANSVLNWNNVVSIKYSLVIRGDTKDNAITDSKTYSLAGDTDYTVADADQNYRRRTYTKLIQLRNMTRG